MEFKGPEVVKVRRVPKAGYFGITAYPRSITTISCQLTKTGYNTGLTKEEEAYYEPWLGLKPGELSRSSKWWGDVFNVLHCIRLNNNKVNEFITTDNPINQLTYKVLLAHDKVANNETEKNAPGVLFYIDDQETKARKELETVNFKMSGMKLIFGLSAEKKRNSLRLFGKRGVDDISEDMAANQLFIELEKDPKQFYDIMTDKDLEMKGFIQELVEKTLFVKSGATYKYGDDTIAGSTEECIQYLKDNQDVELVLRTRLKKLKEPAKAESKK